MDLAVRRAIRMASYVTEGYPLNSEAVRGR
jgi:hypothetical protein